MSHLREKWSEESKKYFCHYQVFFLKGDIKLSYPNDFSMRGLVVTTNRYFLLSFNHFILIFVKRNVGNLVYNFCLSNDGFLYFLYEFLSSVDVSF